MSSHGNLRWLVLSLLVEVIRSSDTKIVTATPGDDASLSCTGPRGAAISLLVWSRPDLKTAQYYVFFYRDERPHGAYQLPRYRGRVALKDPEMKDGDASVVLKNVTIDDTGTYECRVAAGSGGRSKRDDLEPATIIELTVVDPGPTYRRNMDGLVAALSLCALLVLVAVVGVIHNRCNRPPDDDDDDDDDDEGL